MNGGSSLELDPELKTGSGRDTVIGLARHKLGGQSTKEKKRTSQKAACTKIRPGPQIPPCTPQGLSLYSSLC